MLIYLWWIYAAHLLVERYQEENKSIHIAFLDLEKVFDRILHELIWHTLHYHGVPEAYVSRVQLPGSSSSTAMSQVSYKSWNLTALCNTCWCPPRICPLPSGVYPLHGNDHGRYLKTTSMDAIVLLSEEEHEHLKLLTQQWKTCLEEKRLQMNIKTTEYMECGSQTDSTIWVDGQDFSEVTQFKYLSMLICADGDSFPYAQTQVKASWMKLLQVCGVLCDCKIPNYHRAKVYKMVGHSGTLYGTEC